MSLFLASYIIKGQQGTVSVHRQPVFLNLASRRAVNCEFLCQSVGCYNHIWLQKWFWVSLLK